MDLYNNEHGLILTKKRGKTSKKELILKVIKIIELGRLKIIKKDKKGNFLTCKGKIINKKELKGKWINNKCLVSSNSDL